jgi:outer membrane protein OmpA-like peptidoglycan-associated protein
MSNLERSPHEEGTVRGVRPPTWSAGLARLSVAALLLLASAALAQPPVLPNFELERLELNPNGQGSLVVGSGLLLPEKTFRLSLLGHYENKPLEMYDEEGGLGWVVQDRVMVHVLAAWAPLRWLEVGAQLPVVAYQQGDEPSPRLVEAPDRSGLSTPTVHVRVGVLSQARKAPVDLALELGMGLPVGSEAALGRDDGVRFTPRVMLGRSLGRRLRGGVEVSALLRPNTEIGAGTQVDELGETLRLGAVLATQGSGLRGELNVVGDVPLSSTNGAMEILAGLRLPVKNLFELYALGGPGIGDAPGTPTFRVLLGLAAGTGVQGDPTLLLDDDGDGVLNGQDKCRKEAGPIVRQGCPVPDRDRDGIEDAQDKCPDEAGPAVRDGCPVPDRDGDGIEDAQDKCPDEAGPAVRGGCPVPDRDRDGIEDTLDKCPDEAGPAVRDGCPVTDKDGDGIEDAQDKCPTQKGLPELSGCPPEDTDGDRVWNHQDNCLDTKGPASNYGCPVGTVPPVSLPPGGKGPLRIREKIFFATAKSKINPKSYWILDQVADFLEDHPELERISIQGHTDDQGGSTLAGRERNRTLSQERANAVKIYLIKKGVDANRLEALGFGQDKPLIENAKTDEEREVNRRVEFLIITPEPAKK